MPDLHRRLFTVTDTGRGLVLVLGLVPIGAERFRVGDQIVLRLPDGVKKRTSIDALELPHPNPRNEVLIVLKRFEKGDVPIGTEVWSA
jgi:hypothetical protein